MDDPGRSRRKSTIQKSERQKEIELERRNSKLDKSKVDDKNIVETPLTEPAEGEIDTSQLEAVGNEIVRGISVSAVDEEVFEDEEEDFDPLGAVKSPTKRDSVKRDSLVVTLTRERNKDSDNWSVRLNRFFPSDCVISPPPYPSPSYQGNPETWSINNQFFPPHCVLSPRLSRFPSQSSEGQATIEEIYEERGVISQDHPVELLSIEHFPSKMDDPTFQARLREVRKAFAKVDRRVNRFTPEDVTLQDKETYKDYIEETGRVLDEAQDAAFDLCADLDIASVTDGNRIEEVNQIEAKSLENWKKNARDIKKKIQELVDSLPGTNAGGPSIPAASSVDVQNLQFILDRTQREAEKEAQVAAEKVQKVEIKMNNTTKKAKDLVHKLRDVLSKDCEEMTDQEIRENLLNSKDWEKQIETLTANKEAIDLDSVGVVVNKDIKEVFETELLYVIDKVCNLIENLKVVDKEKALHTLAPSKVKENIVYPKAFSGKVGENVYKFVKDFQDAIAADQVREVDKVKKLMQLLKDDAKKAVGEHYKDLKDALEELIRSFGNEEIIWDKIKEDIKEKLGENKKWGKSLSRERLTATSVLFDFLKEAVNLAEDYPDLEKEIYSRSTLSLIRGVLPFDWDKEFVRSVCGLDPSYQTSFQKLMSFAELKKEEINFSLKTRNDDKGDYKFKGNPYGGKTIDKAHHQGKRHDCKNSKDCKTDWELLGCVELYRLAKISERKAFCKSSNHCFTCGGKMPYRHPNTSGKDKTFHKCTWSTSKIAARCNGKLANGEDCWFGAVLCHFHPNNAKPELLTWLNKNNLKIANIVMLGNDGPKATLPINTKNELEEFAEFLKENPGDIEENLQKFQISRSSNKVGVTDIERMKLQTGESNKNMTDGQLIDYFAKDEKNANLLPIPTGFPVFILCIIQGKLSPVRVMIDSGANCWLAQDGIPQTEFTSAKLLEGPIPLGVASGMTAFAEAEWASLLPLADGTNQIVRGLTMKKVTGDIPSYNLNDVFKKIKNDNQHVEALQDITVPDFVGSQVHMILGISYQKHYPEHIHTMPNGLTIFKSKFKPTAHGALACIGGPVEALSFLCDAAGTESTMTYLSYLVQNMKTYKFRVDFSPCSVKQSSCLIDSDIPGIRDLIDEERNWLNDEELNSSCDEETDAVEPMVEDENNVQNTGDDETTYAKARLASTESDLIDNNIKCNDCGEQSNLIQSEMDKFLKSQDSGLDVSYKCPKCRRCKDCLKGAGKERISMQQEAEQEIIKDSVKIDISSGKAIASLAFKADPDKLLTDNEFIAVKRLKNVCVKYSKNPELKESIAKGFQKLIDRGHIIPMSKLTPEQREAIDMAPTTYTIPWDVGFKESSLSTPARPTFDASSKTSGGYSLNDCLAKGDASLIDLVSMVLNWLIGSHAVAGDISQFYNTVELDESHWKYQKVVWYKAMDKLSELEKGVVRTAIYGVRCVGAQCEQIMRLLADYFRNDFPDVADFLERLRYVDDMAKSVTNEEEAIKTIQDTENVLKTVKMKVKGWSVTGQDPSPELTEDGVSVGFGGMTWLPKIDALKLNIQPLHFGKKKRGRFPDDLKKFDGSFGMKIDDFTPNHLTRRMCTSVTARIYDIPGKLAPLALRLKHDLRKLIDVDPDWDNAISESLRFRWIENFKMIEELRDVLYVRCPIPEDALRPTVRLWLMCDGAPSGGMLITAHSGNEKPDKTWSCNHLFSRSLLAPANWSTPQLELHAMNSMANMADILKKSLGDWVEIILYASDSEIALSWVIYEKVKLHIFHRLRVSNIRSKINLEHLFHVQTAENIADTGTRPDLLTVEMLKPGSEWLDGKEWMKRSVGEAIDMGVIKSTAEIKLNNDAKKVFKEGIIYEDFENFITVNNNMSHFTKTTDSQKIIEREQFSDYIFPPLKRSLRPTVRIIALVLRAVQRFKKLLVKKRIKDGSVDKSELQNLNFPPPKFTSFSVLSGKAEITTITDSLVKVFGANGFQSKSEKKIMLTDEELSASLEYIFKKTTAEVLKFNDKKLVDRLGVMKDGILYSKSRLLESQNVRAVGDLDIGLNLKSFTGVNFAVPLIDKFSPLAVSISLHLHYNVLPHRGAETLYRMSLQHANIIQGRTLMKKVCEDCIFCKKLKLKYLKQLMGPLSDAQLSISPIFYYCYIDAWGPVKSYVPGYERETRSGHKIHEMMMLIFGCAATGMINCQMMEGGKNTDCVLDAFNRFFSEACVPKVCLPDKDGAVMKALTEGEIDIIGRDGVLARQRGIYFETCLAQDHSAHGRIEARIKMVQQSLERSNIRMDKMRTMGWQTLAKIIERDVNNIPLGYLQHDTDLGPLLQVLTPNSLKLNTASERAPSGLFTIPGHAKDMITDIEKKYKFWYEIWNTDYIPLIARRQKWFSQDDDLKENDVVYFKLTDTALSSKWHIGKVEYVLPSRDTRTRKVGISFKHDTEDGSRKLSIVDRPVRQVVKLCDIEDSSLLDDITAVRNAAKKIIDDRNVEEIDDSTTPVETFEKPKVKTKKRKSELEKLEIENWQPPTERRRNKTPNKTILSSMNNSDLMSKLSKTPSPPIFLQATNIGYTLPVDNDEQQELENRGREDGLAEWDELFFATDFNCDSNNEYELFLL